MSTCRSCAYARPHDSSYQPVPTGDCDAPLPFWLTPHLVQLDEPHGCRMWQPKNLDVALERDDREGASR